MSTTLLSPRHIESLIADGQIIVILHGKVLKLNRWLDRHPGGRLAILHMIGRDATDEINAYHLEETIKRMYAFQIGCIADRHPWINMTPPIRGGVFRREDEEESPQQPTITLHAGDVTADLHHEPEDTASSQDTASSLGESEEEDRQSLFSRSYNSSHTSLHLLTDEKEEDDVAADETDASSFSSSRYLAVYNKARKRFPLAAAPATSTSAPAATATPSPPPATTTPRHPPHNPRTLAALNQAHLPGKVVTKDAQIALMVRTEVDHDIRDFPALDAATQQAIARKYQALHARVKAEGFYDCRYSEYAKEVARYACLFATFVALFRAGWFVTSAVFLGLFWHQIMFTAHDAGHRGITKNFVRDTLIGMFVGDVCCGLSIGWWKSSHNVHHLVTNHPEHDPDIQNLPLFSTSPSFFRSLASSYYGGFVFYWDAAAALIIPYQKYIYYPIMAFARFNLYFLSWAHLLSPRSANLGSAAWTRPAEIIGMSIYWYLYGYLVVWQGLPNWYTRVAFVITSHLATLPLHVQITLSHWGTSTADLGDAESFAQRQLRTTMDVACPPYLDFVHGGLQFQAIHHLFPRVPRHNLRALQPLVMEFCADTQIEYQCLGFVDGHAKVFGRLDEISRLAEMLIKCQQYMAETGESGLH